MRCVETENFNNLLNRLYDIIEDIDAFGVALAGDTQDEFNQAIEKLKDTLDKFNRA